MRFVRAAHHAEHFEAAACYKQDLLVNYPGNPIVHTITTGHVKSVGGSCDLVVMELTQRDFDRIPA